VVDIPERLLNAELFLHVHVSMLTANVCSKSKTMNWHCLASRV